MSKELKVLHSDVKAKVDAKKSNDWFYSETVKDHFFNPRNFLRDKQEVADYDGFGAVGSPACILKDTRIQTEKEFKPINLLDRKDKVLSHDTSYNKITQFFRPAYSGDLLVLKNQMGTNIMTPDHLVYAMKLPIMNYWLHTKEKQKLIKSWFHASELVRGDISLYPIPKKIDKITSITIPYKKKKWDFRSKELPQNIPIDKNLMTFIGFFIAEGHTNDVEVDFSFGIHEMNFAKKIKNLAKEIFGLDATISKQEWRSTIRVYLYNVQLAHYIRKMCGKLAHNKKVPNFLMNLDYNLQKSLLYGMWHGDGYISFKGKKPRAEYATVSPLLAEQIKTLLLRQKIPLSIYKESAKRIKGVNHKECYRIHIGDYDGLKKMSNILKTQFAYPKKKFVPICSWFDEDYFYVPIRKIAKQNFNGRLMNLEVDKAHSYASNALTLHNCGDRMELWIKVDKKNDKIVNCKWSTFGCGSALSSTSMLSVMVTENGGMKVDDALKIKPQDIVNRLEELPLRKYHCSVLGDKALRSAINDYFRKTKQYNRIVEEGAKMIDMALKITDKDIEEAVLEGAVTFEDLQKKTKIGVQDKTCIPEAKQLLKFYREKYFGKEA